MTMDKKSVEHNNNKKAHTKCKVSSKATKSHKCSGHEGG